MATYKVYTRINESILEFELIYTYSIHFVNKILYCITLAYISKSLKNMRKNCIMRKIYLLSLYNIGSYLYNQGISYRHYIGFKDPSGCTTLPKAV